MLIEYGDNFRSGCCNVGHQISPSQGSFNRTIRFQQEMSLNHDKCNYPVTIPVQLLKEGGLMW